MPPGSLTDQSGDGVWEEWLTHQIGNVANLALVHPHNIKLYERSNPATEKLNCFALAFGINADTISCGVCPNKSFTTQLLQATVLREKNIPVTKASNGDLLIYYRLGSPEHAGRWSNGRVISKWGYGRTHIWEHSIYEVPESYGDDIKLYKPMRPSLAVRAYNGWAAKWNP